MFLGYIDPGTGFAVFSLGGWLIAALFGSLGLFSLFFRRIFRFFRRHKKPVAIALLVIIGIGGIIIGVRLNMAKLESEFDKKVVILGFDGLSPKIVEPMMKAGRLPNFSRLQGQGSYRHLATTNPSQSPVAWTGFSTGQNPGKHGIFDFIVRDPENFRMDLSLSRIEKGNARRVVKSKCFWQYTSEVRVPTVILACPVTFPPDKVYGRMLSGMGVPDILGTEGTFTFYTTETLRKEKDIGGKVFEVKKSPTMELNLIGPRVVVLKGKSENTKVPFRVLLQEDKDSIIVEHGNKKFELEQGEWSDWQEVTFKLGFARRAKGIFKFYLVEARPEFKLYISPVNFDPRSPFFPISYPENYSRELAENLGLYYTQGMPMDTWAVNEKRLTEKPFLEQAEVVLREKKEMLDYELERLEKGVLYCYFESPDIIQHMFWRYTDPQHPLYEENAPGEYKGKIEEWYQRMDEILGGVMEKITPEDTLIVLSDHGFDTFRRAVHVNAWLRKNGYLELKNPAAETGRELLLDLDWSRTRAYALGFGSIYINQEGRERNGIVKPGRETELLKEELTAKLTQWVDEKYGKRIINTVYPREEIFWGDYTGNTPDLSIGFNIGYRASWQTALGSVPEKLIEDNLKNWSGTHLCDPALIPGTIFTNKQITRAEPSIYDITPTVLKIVGYSEESLKELDLDGTPLFD